MLRFLPTKTFQESVAFIGFLRTNTGALQGTSQLNIISLNPGVIFQHLTPKLMGVSGQQS